MSFHFLNGKTYANYEGDGPGTIVVDRFASLFGSAIVGHVLYLSDGPWKIAVNGDVFCETGTAIQLLDAGFTSNITIGSQASVIGAGAGGYGIYTAHATNIVNAGHLLGGTEGIYEFGNGKFSITNTKTGFIEAGEIGIDVLFSGRHTITNAGTILGNLAISGSNGIEVVTNYGALKGGVFLGSDNGILTDFKRVGHHIKNGVITGPVDLGDGNDVFRGGAGAETVRDGNGQDDIKLGGGADTWRGYLGGGGDVFERVDGGAGKDTYDATNAGVSDFAINLDGRAHSGLAAHIADDFDPTTAREKVLNFENAIGTAGLDTLIGSKVANALDGRAGSDVIVGLGGADSLNGGLDGDTFVYTSLKDSGVTRATRDTIHDFDATQDVFNLQPLNDRLGGIISAFLGVNVDFTGHAGDLRAIWNGSQTIVQLDKDGDKDADFTVALDGNIALTAANFMPI